MALEPETLAKTGWAEFVLVDSPEVVALAPELAPAPGEGGVEDKLELDAGSGLGGLPVPVGVVLPGGGWFGLVGREPAVPVIVGGVPGGGGESGRG